jgi:hypothetical protein
MIGRRARLPRRLARRFCLKEHFFENSLNAAENRRNVKNSKFHDCRRFHAL